MKQELLELYNAALRCDDQSAIIQYQNAKNRIAPSIVIDLILDEIEREKLLNEMADAIDDLLLDIDHNVDLPNACKKAKNVLQRYWEGRG